MAKSLRRHPLLAEWPARQEPVLFGDFHSGAVSAAVESTRRQTVALALWRVGVLGRRTAGQRRAVPPPHRHTPQTPADRQYRRRTRGSAPMADWFRAPSSRVVPIIAIFSTYQMNGDNITDFLALRVMFAAIRSSLVSFIPMSGPCYLT